MAIYRIDTDKGVYQIETEGAPTGVAERPVTETRPPLEQAVSGVKALGRATAETLVPFSKQGLEAAASPWVGKAGLSGLAEKAGEKVEQSAMASGRNMSQSIAESKLGQRFPTTAAVTGAVGETLIDLTANQLKPSTMAQNLGSFGLSKSGGLLKNKLKEAFGTILETSTNTPQGAGKIVLNDLSVTKRGYASPEKIKSFAGKVIQGIQDTKKTITHKFGRSVAREEKLGGLETIPSNPILGAMDALRQDLRLGTEGVRKVSVTTERAIDDLFGRITKDLAGKEAISLSKALEIRQAADNLIKYGAGLGEGLEPKATLPFRELVNKLIAGYHPNFKLTDAAYQKGVKTIEDTASLFGIDDADNALEKLTPKELAKIETTLTGFLKKPETFKEAIKDLDSAFTTVDGFLDEAQKFGAAKAFEKMSSGLARIGLLSGVLGGIGSGTYDVAHGRAPGKLTKGLLLFGATSPFLTGVGLRGASHLLTGMRYATPPTIQTASRLLNKERDNGTNSR